MDIRSLVKEFTDKLRLIIEDEVIARARDEVDHVMGRAGGHVAAGSRRKAPPQLCPVPGCKNRAAPALGMVCAEHRDVPKAKIQKYREARRARKQKEAA